jgi:hypothetical protein
MYNRISYYKAITNQPYSAVQASRQRKAAKASNKNGNPVIMKSKILAAVPDPAAPLTCVFIAESAGAVRRINLEVCLDTLKKLHLLTIYRPQRPKRLTVDQRPL